MRNFEQLNRFYQPRRDMARSMMQSGMSTAPVQHWTQGLGRLAQALVGAHLNKKLDAEMEEKLAKRQSKMSEMIKSLMTEKIGEEDIGIEEQFQEQGGLNKFTPPTPESLGISPPIDEATGKAPMSYANDMDKFKMITDAQTIADGGIPKNTLTPGSNEMTMGKFTQPQRYQGTGEGYARATNDVMGLGKMGKTMLAYNEMFPGGMEDIAPILNYQNVLEGRKYSSELMKQKRGYDREDADIKFGRDKALKEMGLNTPTSTMKEYNYALEEPGFKEFLKVRGSENISKRLQEWNAFKDMSDEDQQRFLTMSRANQNINLGGSVLVPNPANPAGKPLQTWNKTVPPQDKPGFKMEQSRQSAIGSEVGKYQGKAKAGLPVAEVELGEMLSLVDETLAHPGLKDVIGLPDDPRGLKGYMPGSPAAGFKALHDQVTSKAFLQAFESLKGGGHITEIEGEKATKSALRASTAQSEVDYVKSMREFAYYAKLGLEKAKRKANPAYVIKMPEMPEHMKKLQKRRKEDIPPPPGNYIIDEDDN